MKMAKAKIIFSFMLGFLLVLIPCGAARAADRVQPVGERIVIVIDPGHGGDNLGTQSGHTIEKEMTMVTAKAMQKELEKYDNVTVYLTHTNDKDMSLKERAQFASEKGADFLFSIHYNASEYHTMYGTEVWVSCETPYNAYGYQFGYLHLQAMEEKGLFLRGVKNRKNDDGTDWYGIIRESAERSVPAVIIEHCYVDEERDAEYIQSEEDYAEFGRADAQSVAKYFGLKSALLGVDYSGEPSKLQPASASALVPSTLMDATSPDVCEIELLECDYATGETSLAVRAADYDSPLIYYDYSIDNGQSWTRLESWPGSNTLTGEYTDTFQLNLTIPGGTRPNIVLRAYNMADLYKKSNVLQFDQTISKREKPASESGAGEPAAEESAAAPATEPLEHEHKSIGTTTFMPADAIPEENDSTVGILTFLKFCLVLVIILFVIVLTAQIVGYRKRKKRRQRR